MKQYFCGQYDKCQSDTQTLAVISAVHGGSRSVQLITDSGAWNFTKHLDRCRFSRSGFTLDLSENGICVEGSVQYGAFHFTGVIGVILWRGKEYRLATYLGARAVKIGDGAVVIRQGDYTFSAQLTEKNAHPLSAPVSGAMVRTIHESAACRAVYCLEKGKETLFAFETDKASFEFEYGGKP